VVRRTLVAKKAATAINNHFTFLALMLQVQNQICLPTLPQENMKLEVITRLYVFAEKDGDENGPDFILSNVQEKSNPMSPSACLRERKLHEWCVTLRKDHSPQSCVCSL
jgi:hypothetical protein